MFVLTESGEAQYSTQLDLIWCGNNAHNFCYGQMGEPGEFFSFNFLSIPATDKTCSE